MTGEWLFLLSSFTSTETKIPQLSEKTVISRHVATIHLERGINVHFLNPPQTLSARSAIIQQRMNVFGSKPKSPATVALLAAFAAMFIWSSSHVIGKIALAYFPPLTVTALRYFSGSMLLMLFIMRKPGAVISLKNISTKTWLKLAAIGISAYTVGSGMLHYGLKTIPSTLAGFSDAIIPVLVFIAGIFILKEYPTRVQTSGMIAVAVGSFFFLTQGDSSFQSPIIGYIYLGISIMGFVVFNLLSRMTARDRTVDALTQTAIPLGIGGGILIILALVMDGVPKFTPMGTLIIVWLTVFNTALGYFLFNFSLADLTALQVNAVMSLTPLSTALIARVLLGETLTVWQYAAMALVVLGVYLVQTGHGRQPNAPAASSEDNA